MRVSQLIHVMERDVQIIIDDMSKKIDVMTLYEGSARGIKKDDPLNKMHVVGVFPVDDSTIHILVKSKSRDRIWKGYSSGKI
jgi:molybdopterin synthase catalytic subunit